MDRRDFLKLLGAGGAGAALAPLLALRPGTAGARELPALPDNRHLARYPIEAESVLFGGPSLTDFPQPQLYDRLLEEIGRRGPAWVNDYRQTAVLCLAPFRFHRAAPSVIDALWRNRTISAEVEVTREVSEERIGLVEAHFGAVEAGHQVAGVLAGLRAGRWEIPAAFFPTPVLTNDGEITATWEDGLLRLGPEMERLLAIVRSET